jgi:hypothetical protein
MGEKVRVYTRRPDGPPRESILWLVEREGHAWLRAGRPDADWLERIHGEPRVEVARNGRRRAYRAVPVEAPDVRAAVNEAMARKYGLADRLVRWLVGVDHAVPVRLDPLEEDGAPHAPAR